MRAHSPRRPTPTEEDEGNGHQGDEEEEQEQDVPEERATGAQPFKGPHEQLLGSDKGASGLAAANVLSATEIAGRQAASLRLSDRTHADGGQPERYFTRGLDDCALVTGYARPGGLVTFILRSGRPPECTKHFNGSNR